MQTQGQAKENPGIDHSGQVVNYWYAQENGQWREGRYELAGELEAGREQFGGSGVSSTLDLPAPVFPFYILLLLSYITSIALSFCYLLHKLCLYC